MNFYKTSLMIMVVVLIICLSVLGVVIQSSETSKLYPPTVADCPDYYVKNSDGICEDPTQTLSNIESCNTVNPEADFPKRKGIGKRSGLCRKKRWAEGCNINWDGITNNENICYG
jgi:hypothetical protein